MRHLTLALVVLFGLAWVGCDEERDLVIFEVTARDFVHRVEAEGLLQAAITTDVTVPSGFRSQPRLLWLAESGSRVEADEVVARFDAVDLHDRREDRLADLSTNDLRLDRASSQSEDRLAAVDKNFEVAGLELDVASQYQLTDEEVFSRIEVLESQLDADLAQERRDSALRVRPVEGDLAETERELLRVARRKVQIELDKADKGLGSLEIRAPHSGIFQLQVDKRGEPLQVGQMAYPGQVIGKLPDLNRIEAEVYVLEADAGGLEVGRPAELRLASSPGTPIRGSIKRVDPVASRRERGSSLQYFGVTVSIDDPPAELKPGLRVQATLELARVEDALVVPRQAVFLEQGRPHVWRQEGSGFVATRVEIGPQTAGNAVIEAGLEPGQRISLEDPLDGERPEAEPASVDRPAASKAKKTMTRKPT